MFTKTLEAGCLINKISLVGAQGNETVMVCGASPSDSAILKNPHLPCGFVERGFSIWVFPKIGVSPQNGWFIINGSKPYEQMDDLGGIYKPNPYFWLETPISTMVFWVMVSNIVYFHPYLGKISNLINIFQMG